ncbi:MAG: metal-sulfur cluster assembly factor [Parafilimonas sp.]
MNVVTNNNINCSIALTALQNVLDPEIGLNVVDLGLIYQLDFDEENRKIYCSMTLTTQFCPMGESIADGVKNALQNTFSDYTIEVNVTFNPAWNQAMISDEGKKFLNK